MPMPERDTVSPRGAGRRPQPPSTASPTRPPVVHTAPGLLQRFDLPVAVLVHKASDSSLGADPKRPLLLYKKYISTTVRAHFLEFHSDCRRISTAPDLIIPETCNGWFSVASAKGESPAPCFTSLSKMLKEKPEAFISKYDVPVYVLENDGRKCFREVTLRSGEILQCANICTHTFKNKNQDFIKCVTLKNDSVLLPLSTSGVYYIVDTKHRTIGRVYRLSHILKCFTLPLTVKLVCGDISNTSYSFSEYLRLEKRTVTPVLLACTMTGQAEATFNEIDVHSDTLFSVITDPMYSKLPIYLKTVSYCQDFGTKWQREIKMCQNATRIQSTVTSFSEKFGIEPKITRRQSMINPIKTKDFRWKNYLVDDNIKSLEAQNLRKNLSYVIPKTKLISTSQLLNKKMKLSKQNTYIKDRCKIKSSLYDNDNSQTVSLNPTKKLTSEKAPAEILFTTDTSTDSLEFYNISLGDNSTVNFEGVFSSSSENENYATENIYSEIDEDVNYKIDNNDRNEEESNVDIPHETKTLRRCVKSLGVSRCFQFEDECNSVSRENLDESIRRSQEDVNLGIFSDSLEDLVSSVSSNFQSSNEFEISSTDEYSTISYSMLGENECPLKQKMRCFDKSCSEIDESEKEIGNEACNKTRKNNEIVGKFELNSSKNETRCIHFSDCLSFTEKWSSFELTTEEERPISTLGNKIQIKINDSFQSDISDSLTITHDGEQWGSITCTDIVFDPYAAIEKGSESTQSAIECKDEPTYYNELNRDSKSNSDKSKLDKSNEIEEVGIEILSSSNELIINCPGNFFSTNKKRITVDSDSKSIDSGNATDDVEANCGEDSFDNDSLNGDHDENCSKKEMKPFYFNEESDSFLTEDTMENSIDAGVAAQYENTLERHLRLLIERLALEESDGLSKGSDNNSYNNKLPPVLEVDEMSYNDDTSDDSYNRNSTSKLHDGNYKFNSGLNIFGTNNKPKPNLDKIKYDCITENRKTCLSNQSTKQYDKNDMDCLENEMIEQKKIAITNCDKKSRINNESFVSELSYLEDEDVDKISYISRVDSAISWPNDSDCLYSDRL